MTELRINKGTSASPKWEAVDLPSSFSTTLTSENVIYTKSSEYTYDFELPLASSANNSRLFGAMYRRDVTKKGDTYRCMLIVDNRTIIENGVALVTSINADTINLQLMGGNSEVNFRSKLEKMYIDKIDLGNAVQDINEFHEKYSLMRPWSETLNGFREWVKWAAQQPMVTKQDPARFETDETNLLADVCMRTVDDFPFVMLPAKDTSTNALVNRFGMVVDSDYYTYHNWPRPYLDSMGTTSDGEAAWFMKFENMVYCPQPYLLTIIKKVINYLGYTINTNMIHSSLFKNIYIASTTNTIEYAKMLPHWTVNEFITEIEHLFNCVVVFNGNQTVDIYSRAQYFVLSSNNHIDLAIDSSYVTDTQSDELEDVNASNMSFEFDDKLHKFDDTINDHARFVFSTTPDATLSGMGDPAKFGAVVYDGDGRHFISMKATKDGETDKTIEANQLRNLKRSDDADDITLKIVPAKIGVDRMAFYQPSPLKYSEYYLAPMPFAESMPIETKVINICGYIRGTEDYEDGNDGNIMQVALFDGIEKVYTFSSSNVGPGVSRSEETKNIPVFAGWTIGAEDLYQLYDEKDSFRLTDLSFPDKTELLRLVDIGSHNTIGSVFHGAGQQDETQQVDIDAKNQVEIQFADDHLKFDLRKPFIIGGKKYICLSISANINELGFEKIKTGIFFPLDNN